MRKQWSEKNVDLTLLREDVKNFFASKGFDVKAELLEEQYRILIKPRRMQEVLENITVSINGKTNNFEIEFSAGQQGRSTILLGFLTTIIGGGKLVLKGLKSKDVVKKLEEDFWSYVERRIMALTNSARQS